MAHFRIMTRAQQCDAFARSQSFAQIFDQVRLSGHLLAIAPPPSVGVDVGIDSTPMAPTPTQ